MTRSSRPRTGGRPRPVSRNQLPDELEQLLTPIAQQAVEQEMTLGEAMHSGPLAQLIGRFVEIALQAEMDQHLGYGWGQRQKAQQGQENLRNGYSTRQLKTELGAVTIEKPRDRQGTFESQLLPSHGQLSDTLTQQILSLYTRGMSTRDIQHHIQNMYHLDIDSDLVSRVVAKVEPDLIAWRSRPLTSTWACVFLDAIHLKVRQPTGVESTAVYVAIGYDCEGARHILGVWMAPEGQTGESAHFWHQALLELKNRGVQDIFILCADGLQGLEEATQLNFPKARFQPCVVHLIRNSMKYLPYDQRKEVATKLKTIYLARTFEAAQDALKVLKDTYGAKEPHLVRVWEEALPRLENLWTYGEALRRMVYTTNIIENMNRQIRKSTKTRGSFPSIPSALRLVTLVLIEAQESYKKRRGDWQEIRTELVFTFSSRVPSK